MSPLYVNDSSFSWSFPFSCLSVNRSSMAAEKASQLSFSFMDSMFLFRSRYHSWACSRRKVPVECILISSVGTLLLWMLKYSFRDSHQRRNLVNVPSKVSGDFKGSLFPSSLWYSAKVRAITSADILMIASNFSSASLSSSGSEFLLLLLPRGGSLGGPRGGPLLRSGSLSPSSPSSSSEGFPAATL